MGTRQYTGINLDTVREILTQATVECDRLAGIVLVDTDSARVNREQAAEVTRDLLFLADTLQTAAVLTKNEYWYVKGRKVVDV